MICKKCAHENYCDMAQFGGHIPPITACFKFKEKSLTNADRIRAMTDEELGRFLYIKTCEDGYPQFDTIMGWFDWMKQSAEESE